MNFDPNLPYVESFFDAVQRETDRVTSDPGTQALGDRVNARGMANELERVARGRANVANAYLRHGQDSPNVPDVVGQQIGRATSCHLATAKNVWPYDQQQG